jgi:anthranilate synthase
MQFASYITEGGIRVHRAVLPQPYEAAGAGLAEKLIDDLERRRGVLLASGFEFPGRYSRFAIGFVDPPLVLTARGRGFTLDALNERGRLLLPPIAASLAALPALASLTTGAERIMGTVHEAAARFPEEERSRQPSLFSVLRVLAALFAGPDDPHLGLYGAFGYDLVFQFEPMKLALPRAGDQRDLVLYLPDEILVIDHLRQQAALHRYEFETPAGGTAGLARVTVEDPWQAGPALDRPAVDHAPGAYAAAVERARAAFKRGDMFEAVLSQVFSAPCSDGPAAVFRRLRQANPAPYGALMNLGDGEFLVAASPEMFVRVEGRRIETCPIAGTIARGRDAIEDAARIRELLNSAKDESELTMCTDVDRNDKSRVCVPGSVKVIGRRQLELYSRLIHTVDHVEGTLRDGFDAFDGFLSHAWAVTVTGAPKPAAIRFIEDEETTARRWYGGALGRVTFDGNMNTGLTLRTVRMKDGVAEVRAGATLLYDSDPQAEDTECRLKASALLAAIGAERTVPDAVAPRLVAATPSRAGQGKRVLLIDHADSFVHTLGGYFREAGAEVTTLRVEAARAALDEIDPDLVVLSPGPGRPADFAMGATLDLLIARFLPVFGVCLGLQGIVEYFGGALDVLDMPMHGKPSAVRVTGGRLLAALPQRFTVGRYHSLHARRAALPATLMATAESDDGIVMAIEHVDLPIAAVQFHPESVMTGAGAIGLPIIRAALALGDVAAARVPTAAHG